MTNLLQVLSEKAKETREQFQRTVQAPGSAAALPKIDQLGRPSEPRSRSPHPEQELQDLLPKNLSASESSVPPTDSAVSTSKPEESLPQPLPNHIRLALVTFAIACLLYTHFETIIRWLKASSFGLLDVVALVCIVAAAPAIPRAQVQQSIQAVKLQVIAAGVAVKALPQMSIEMSAMLDEIRAMRRDVGGMAKKAAWLPGS